MYLFRQIRLRNFSMPLFQARNLSLEKNIVKSPADKINVPKNILLQDYFLEQISKFDDTVAVECVVTKRNYTHSELKKKSLALAHFLKYGLKLEEKAVVGVLLPNLPEYLIILLGALRAGLTITTINPIYTQDEIKEQLIHSNAKVLFTLAEMEGIVSNITKKLDIPIIAVRFLGTSTLSHGTIDLSDVINTKGESLEDIQLKQTPEDVALLPYSSGTTGLPKGVELTHNNIVSNVEQSTANEFTNFIGNQDVIFSILPFFHIYGLAGIFQCVGLGAKLISFPKFTGEIFLKALRAHRPTFIPLAPPIVQFINNNPQINPSEDFASLRLILSGAAPLSAIDIERFYDITKGKVDIIQGYGLTETSPVVLKQTKLLKGGVKIGGSGLLVPNTEAKFISVDNPQNSLGPNESGELLVRGPQVMKGYYNNPKATIEAITKEGWLHTGDIGYYDEDGQVFITDRLKELIKVQGFQVAPAELESVLRNHPSVEDVAVVGVDHERFGEAPRAFIVPKKDVKVKSEEIQEFIAERLAKYKHLTGGVVFLESIPKSSAGKILRKELKKLNGRENK